MTSRSREDLVEQNPWLLSEWPSICSISLGLEWAYFHESRIRLQLSFAILFMVCLVFRLGEFVECNTGRGFDRGFIYSDFARGFGRTIEVIKGTSESGFPCNNNVFAEA